MTHELIMRQNVKEETKKKKTIALKTTTSKDDDSEESDEEERRWLGINGKEVQKIHEKEEAKF